MIIYDWLSYLKNLRTNLYFADLLRHHLKYTILNTTILIILMVIYSKVPSASFTDMKLNSNRVIYYFIVIYVRRLILMLLKKAFTKMENYMLFLYVVL